MVNLLLIPQCSLPTCQRLLQLLPSQALELLLQGCCTQLQVLQLHICCCAAVACCAAGQL